MSAVLWVLGILTRSGFWLDNINMKLVAYKGLNEGIFGVIFKGCVWVCVCGKHI